MLPDWIDLGPVPAMEDCAQVGRDGYWEQARRECRAYVNLLRRTMGAEPEGARLSVKSNEHDFGTYLSVVCFYDPSVSGSVDYALRCESEGPAHWDEEARFRFRGLHRVSCTVTWRSSGSTTRGRPSLPQSDRTIPAPA